MTTTPETKPSPLIVSRRDKDNDVAVLTAAVAILHEQAHGSVHVRFCPLVPCHDLAAQGYWHTGAVPATLPRMF